MSDFDLSRDQLQHRVERLRHFADAKNRIDYNRFFGACDSMLESSLAASSYERSFKSGDFGSNVLNCYGFLQALFVMQDAVRSASFAVLNKDFDVYGNLALARIRSARNRIAGHPPYAEKEKGDALGISSAFFPVHAIEAKQFRAHLYLEKASTDIIVEVTDWREVNKRELAKQLVVIGDAITVIERDVL